MQAALDFAAAIVSGRGRLTDVQLAAARNAGYGDAEAIEIVAHLVTNNLHQLLQPHRRHHDRLSGDQGAGCGTNLIEPHRLQ